MERTYNNHNSSVYREIQRTQRAKTAEADDLPPSNQPKKCADYLDERLFKPNLTKLKDHVLTFYQDSSSIGKNHPIQALFNQQNNFANTKSLQSFLDFIAKRFKAHILKPDQVAGFMMLDETIGNLNANRLLILSA